MYFAQMYCYGRDNAMVGISGIRGCIGMVYAGQASMYAIHIPDNGATENLRAGKVFSTWVKNQEGKTGKKHGNLFIFANGTNRSLKGKTSSTAEEESAAVKKALNNPSTQLYRIMQHLGPNSGKEQAEGAAIMLERVHATASNPSGCAVWYKQDNKISWTGVGSAEDGQYLARPAFCGTKAPSDLSAGWWRADGANCNITAI